MRNFFGGITEKLGLRVGGVGERDNPEELYENFNKIDVFLSFTTRCLILEKHLSPSTRTYIWHNSGELLGKLKQIIISIPNNSDIIIDFEYSNNELSQERLKIGNKIYQTTYQYYQPGMVIGDQGIINQNITGRIYQEIVEVI